MIEMLESRRLLSALPVTQVPAEEPKTIRIVTLEEFLQLEAWNDDEIVVEWYGQPSKPSDGGGSDDDDWQYELEEDEMSGEDGWIDGVCDGPADHEEPLDDEDFALVAESDVLEAPIAMSAGDDASAAVSFSDVGSITDEVLGAGDDDGEDDLLA